MPPARTHVHMAISTLTTASSRQLVARRYPSMPHQLARTNTGLSNDWNTVIMQDFNIFTQRLDADMAAKYVAVCAERNPVIRILDQASFGQLAHILSQYALFPKELVELMHLAKDKAHAAGWQEVVDELEHNIAEEMGSTTQGVSHYLLLANGLEEALGMPVVDSAPSPASAKLLAGMRGIFDRNVSYALGATYAVEATSIPELSIVLRVLRTALGGAVPQGLQYFFDMHMNEWEPEHKADLHRSVAKYLRPEDYQAFEAGFRGVMEVMDIWWHELAAEARSSERANTAGNRATPASSGRDMSTNPYSIEAARQDRANATSTGMGLQGHYYFSDEIFAHEMQTLWSTTWQLAGRESELKNPGDYITCTIADHPLFVIRSKTGALQAMHNVCPHRGARMLEGQGNCNLVRCSYHAWSFDLEGKLQGLPQAKYFPRLDRSQIHLEHARVDTWGGFVFVCLAPEGESLQRYLGGFSAFLEQYEHRWEDLEEVDRWHYDEPANWKFPVENYRECYHLPVVHAKSLECFVPESIEYTPTGRHYQIAVPYADQDTVEAHPSFPGRRKGMSYQGHIFPNMMVNTAKDMVSVFRPVPVTPETTRFDVFIYQTKMQMEAYPYQQEAFRAEFDQVLMEDFMAVRQLQKTLRSRARRVHLADRLEFGIAHFHDVLAAYYEQR